MTIDRIALKELVEKGSDADLLREMIAFIATSRMRSSACDASQVTWGQARVR